MSGPEQKIKEYVRSQGVEVVGIAGPDRLDGPPSLDPTYTMKGARSIVSLALPMDVGAIYDFLGKKSPLPHNLDQFKMNQHIRRVAMRVACFIESSLGHRAQAVPTNNTYRRSLDLFATHPSFSHRFGAVASGIAAQGWSGNVMTKEYGAAVYLSTVVTDAVLASDPPIPPRYFIDGYCATCKLCEKTCVAGMFESEEEEYVLLNGELHPRGRRLEINLCNASCFGLHALSRDKKWTTWGWRWIEDWVDHPPDPARESIRGRFLKEGAKAGDSAPRYDFIRRIASLVHPEDLILDYCDSHPEKDRESARFRNFFLPFAERIGVKGLKDERILTCGQCALICGPSLEETAKRYKTLVESGLVVPGPKGEMVNVQTYEEAVEFRKRHLPEATGLQKLKDAVAVTWIFIKYYFGVELNSILRGVLYNRRLRKAVRERTIGRNEAVCAANDEVLRDKEKNTRHVLQSSEEDPIEAPAVSPRERADEAWR